MCLLILKPELESVPTDYLLNAWENNEDGAGLVWRDEHNHLHIRKGIWTVGQLIDLIELHEEYEMMIHFRFSTHGVLSKANTHPFKVNNSIMFAHNGVLSEMPVESRRSDTKIFVEDHLQPLLTNQIEVKEWQRLLVEMAMFGSKGILMTPTTTHILHEANGIWENEIWYSNNGYKFSAIPFHANVPYGYYEDDKLWIDGIEAQYIKSMEKEEPVSKYIDTPVLHIKEDLNKVKPGDLLTRY